MDSDNISSLSDSSSVEPLSLDADFVVAFYNSENTNNNKDDMEVDSSDSDGEDSDRTVDPPEDTSDSL